MDTPAKQAPTKQFEERTPDGADEKSEAKSPCCRALRRWSLGTAITLLALIAIGGGAWLYITKLKPVTIEEPPDYDELLARLNNELANSDPTPLDPALRRAGEGLRNIRKNIDDYTAIIIKHERVQGELQDEQQMFCKIRNRKAHGDEVRVPFGVYLKFLSPEDIEGREVIWVEGQNDGRLVAHEAKGVFALAGTTPLDPNGLIAMAGQRYPITEIGFENLLAKLIIKGLVDRNRDADVQVRFVEGKSVDNRPASMIEILHPEKVGGMEYYIARIYIDDEWNIPTKLESYYWPETEGGEPLLLESYTYTNLKLNVGLTDQDFDIENPEYNFP